MSDDASTPTQKLTDARMQAKAVAGSVTDFKPGQSLPSRASWFTDETNERLVVVADPDAPQAAVDKAFAYALAWQHDRDLILILTPEQAPPALHRLPWIGTPVQVWTVTDGSEPRPVVVPTRDEVLAYTAQWPVYGGAGHDLGDGAAWVAALTEAADAHWALARHDRASYLAWHCAGHRVLQMRKTAKVVLITAGVQYRHPKEGQEPPQIERVTAALSPGERARIEAVIAKAVSNRLNHIDNSDVESRMQAVLAAADMPGLDLVLEHAREYPAWRPIGRRGFLDFLGIDAHNRLHVVETKVGGDGMLVIQALDYLIWVTAQAGRIRADRGWPAPEIEGRVHLDLVLAPKHGAPALGPYTAGQLEALAGDVPWRVFLVADPHAPTPKVEELPRQAIHDPQDGLVATPVQPPRFAGRIQRQLRDTSP